MTRKPAPAPGPSRERPYAPLTESGVAPRAVRRGFNLAFGELLDSVPGAWFFTRRDGSFAYVSAGACEALGYSRCELLALRVFDIDPALDAASWARRWEGTEPNRSRVHQTRHRRRDGSEYPIEIRSLEIELEGERISASYSVDLTASEATRAALVATESRLARLLEHLPDLVFRLRLDPEPQLEFVSPSCEALLGYRPDEIVGAPRALARIVHPEDLRTFLAMEESSGVELRFLHRSGQTVWMEVRLGLVPAVDGRERVIEGVARDVTQSHEAALANRRLLAAIEQAAEAVVVTDSQGNVEYVNPAYRHTTGISEREAVGRPWRELEIKKDRAFLRKLDAVFQRGDTWQGRIHSVRPGGVPLDEDATVAPIRDASGRAVGCVAVKRDITEQLQLEEQLQQAQKMEAVGQLAGGIAHDFNNLLHVILGHTRIMQALDLGGTPRAAELREMLAEVDKAADRAAVLVRQLLAFSRRGGAEFSELGLDALLEASLPVLSRLLGTQTQLIWTSNAGNVRVHGNAAQLEQMVTNLCINARDAMPPGGYVRISLDAVSPAELPSLLRGPGRPAYVRVSVRDEGAGMTREVQRRLYEPFFTTKRPGEGVGLGLSTVYAIVQAHHGFIESSSAPGQGSTFNVYLPRTDGPERIAPRRGPHDRVDGRGRLALVAEDEPSVLQLTSSYLQQAGFEVIGATTGPEAEHHIEERGRELALAVLDAVMPGFGGQGVYQVIKQHGLDVPVVFVTGYDYHTLAGALGERRVTILRKPFGMDELLGHVQRLLAEPS